MTPRSKTDKNYRYLSVPTYYNTKRYPVGYDTVRDTARRGPSLKYAGLGKQRVYERDNETGMHIEERSNSVRLDTRGCSNALLTEIELKIKADADAEAERDSDIFHARIGKLIEEAEAGEDDIPPYN